MTMHNDIDHVFFHYANVCLRIHRTRCSEKDVGEFGTHHGSAPTIRKTCTQCLTHQRFRIRRTTHVCHMHGLGNFSIDGSWRNVLSFPDVLALHWRTFQKPLCAERLSVFVQAGQRDFMRNVVDIFSFGLDLPLFCNAQKLFFILDFVISVRRCFIKCMRNTPSMIRVRCSAACRKTQVVSCNDAVHVASADSTRGLFRYSARTHGTDTAASSGLTKTAVWCLICNTLLPGIRANFFRCL